MKPGLNNLKAIGAFMISMMLLSETGHAAISCHKLVSTVASAWARLFPDQDPMLIFQAYVKKFNHSENVFVLRMDSSGRAIKDANGNFILGWGEFTSIDPATKTAVVKFRGQQTVLNTAELFILELPKSLKQKRNKTLLVKRMDQFGELRSYIVSGMSPNGNILAMTFKSREDVEWASFPPSEIVEVVR